LLIAAEMMKITMLTKRNYSSSAKISHLPKIDRFGNSIYDIKFQSVSIKELVSTAKPGKAVVLHNVKNNFIKEYNNLQNNNKQMIAKSQLNSPTSNTFLIRNGSNCPELHNGMYYAGGVSIIVKYLNKYYALLAKDKTKNYLTVPGGSANDSDLVYDKQGHIDLNKTGYNIGIRELCEETTGTNKEGITLKGIDLSESAGIVRASRFQFKSKFFDVSDINDIYTMSTYYFDLDILNHYSKITYYLHKLFSEQNKIIGKTAAGNTYITYKMEYIDHSETEYIYATQLLPAFMLTGSLIYEEHKEWDIAYQENEHPVTNLHLSRCYLNLAKILQKEGIKLLIQIGLLEINADRENVMVIRNASNNTYYPKNLVKIVDYY
jgi:hypothetical protein